MIFDHILNRCKKEGLRRDKEWEKQGRYDYLSVTPFLYPSSDLMDMVQDAKTKLQYEDVLDHMYRHDVLHVDSYKAVEQTVIDCYYERRWIR
jgi:hypothetical protein